LVVILLTGCGETGRQTLRETAARDVAQDTSGATASMRPDSAPAVGEPTGCAIGADAVGPIRIGMTLGEARAAYAPGSLARSSDGDGAALVAVTVADSAIMVLDADEDDADTGIDWSRTISSIETFSALCRRPDGVGPGSLVSEVEAVLGPTRRVTLNEIESRQYIEFDRQPSGVFFRIDYSGEFAPGARVSTRTAPGARILSVALVRISRP
jgi:hypothetical protein